MGQVTYIIVSENVYDGSEEGRMIAKPFSTLFLPEIPNNFSFALSFGLVDLKYDVEYLVNVSIIDPKGNTKFDHSFPHKFESEKMNRRPDAIVTNDLTVKFNNFLFNCEGHYLFRISLDDESKELIFPVYKVRKKGE